MDPKLQQLLKRHADSERESVARDVAPFRDLSPEERGAHLDAACRPAADAVAASPYREAILARRGPEHPDWRRLIDRARGG